MSDNALFKQMDSSLSNYLFKQREDNFVHATLSQEMELFSIVASGDVKTVEKRVARHNTGNLPTLSDDPVRNQQYLFVSWLSTAFAKEVGVPISTYIRNQKLGAAKYLLEFNDYNISDIAEYLGFAGESHFSTAFRKLTGMTPREYRKANYQKQFTGMAGNT